MLRRCVPTVFGETDSSPAISGRDRLVGRYLSTLSSPGLSFSAGGGEDCSLTAGDSSSREPVIANGSTSRSGSARAKARSAAWSAARWSPSSR